MKKPLWVVAILATVASIVANLIIMFLAKPFGPDFLILDTAAVTIFSIGGTVGATIAFLIVKKLSKDYKKTYIIVSAIALVISLIPDIMIFIDPDPRMGVPTPIGIFALMAMHVAEAAIIVYSFMNYTD